MSRSTENGLNPSYRIFGVHFQQYTSEEIKKLSVKEITNPVSIDMLLNVNRGGLYDPELGTQKPGQLCEKCGLPFSPLPGIRSPCYCPGHMGHISLPLPVFNPLNFQLMFQILRTMCFHCGLFLKKKSECLLFMKQMEALDKGALSAVDDLATVHRAASIEFGEALESSDFQVLSERLKDCLIGKLKEYNNKNPNNNDNNNNINNNYNPDNVPDATSPSSRTTTTSFSIIEKTKHIENVRKDCFKKFFERKGTHCPKCKKKPRNLRHEHMARIYFTNKVKFMKVNLQITDSTTSEDRITTQDIVTPVDACFLLRKLYANHPHLLDLLCGFRSHKDGEEEDDNDEEKMVDGGDDSGHGDDGGSRGDGGVRKGGKDCPMDTFFIENLLIIPARFRPMTKFKFTMTENPESMNLKFILNASNELKSLIIEEKKKGVDKKKTSAESLHRAWHALQTRVNAHLDDGLCRIYKDVLPGVKQIIEKKQGLLRKNMMGKRVNSAARSVISPDPYIACNEVGVPVEFARRLVYAEVVQPRNFPELRAAVINGPDEYPGAYSIQMEDDRLVSLHGKTRAQREAVANQLLTPMIINGFPSTNKKKVKRHLKTGDIMVLNRQPTLHKPSMQTFKARVLPMEKTLRINYTPCKAFNADFDGDEMNAHFPQNDVARAEAYTISCADEQYLVPKDGKPIAGLIQDHMVSGVLLTVRGRFFHRIQYEELVYAALTNHIPSVRLLPPSIVKPSCLWSGKQVLSTLILNVIPRDKPPLSLKGKSKISDQEWINDTERSTRNANLTPVGKIDRKGKKLSHDVTRMTTTTNNKLDKSYPYMSENDVLIVDGELLLGVLDKNHYGASAYGLVHWCYELYGGEISSKLLTCLGRLFTYFLRSQRSFTMGIEDIIISERGDEERKKKIEEVRQCGREVLARAMLLPPGSDTNVLIDGLKRVQFSKKRMDLLELDGAINTQMTQNQDKIKKSCWPQNLIKSFPSNNLTLMVQSGAKGSVVNCMQISCLLGQVDLEGCRPPIMITGASLPSFKPYDLHPRAGGFIDDRFLTGLHVQEYFFHCMAGRDGLVDTAVKTSRSGYLQRCLIKHLEGLLSAYDETVRDSDGSIIQFKYGEDGLDVMRTSFLDKKQYSQMIENQHALISKETVEEVFGKTDTERAMRLQREIEEWKRTHPDFTIKTPFGLYSERHWDEVNERLMVNNGGGGGGFGVNGEREMNDQCFEELAVMFERMNDKQRRRLQKKLMPCPDPVSSVLPAARYFGCTSQLFYDTVEEYIRRDDDKVLITEEQLKKLVKKLRKKSLSSFSSSFSSSSSSSPLMRHPYKITSESLRKMLYLKFQKSLIQPGEAVGILAATSMGEQTTQMTLNTFHFAGHGAMNVTLGIPRLREILMVASKEIKTPMMMVPLITIGEKLERRVNRFIKKFRRVPLEKVISSVQMKKTLSFNSTTRSSRLYTIKFNLAPLSSYKSEFNLNPAKVLHYLESKFISHLARVIEKQERDLAASSLLNTKRVSLNVFKKKSGDGDDDDDDGDDNHGGKVKTNGAGDDLGKRVGDDDDSDDDDDDDGDGEEADGKRKDLNQDADEDEDGVVDNDDGDDDDDDDDGGEGGDNDAGKNKNGESAVTKDKGDNDDDDDEDNEGDDNDNGDNDDDDGNGGDDEDEDGGGNLTEKKRKITKKDGKKELMIDLVGGDGDDDEEKMMKMKMMKMEVDNERVMAVCSKSHMMSYTYDVQDNMWGEVTMRFNLAKKEMDVQWLIDNEIKRTVINQVSNISNCIMKEIDINDSPPYMFQSAVKEMERVAAAAAAAGGGGGVGRRKKLQVEGLNIQELYKYQDKLSIDELYCNNIQAIAQHYGIEAASQVIIEEIRQVFKAYGIDVDYRHLSLIADYMTFEGSFKPFNRLGLDSNASPLQKMSFESALNYLRRAIIDGSRDNADSPSSRLILGRPIKTGTGCFDLVVPVV